MKNSIYKSWLAQLQWMEKSLEKKKARLTPLNIKPPVSIESVEQLEQKLEVTYPNDFKKTLTEFAGALHFDWCLDVEKEELPKGLNEVQYGGGRGYIWDFNELENAYSNYRCIMENLNEIDLEIYEELEENHEEIKHFWSDKIPFISVPNGDLIAFGEEGKGYPVFYLSHETYELNVFKLGDDFTDFINKWINIGCAGPEEWVLYPFSKRDENDKESQLQLRNSNIKKWKEWLNSE